MLHFDAAGCHPNRRLTVVPPPRVSAISLFALWAAAIWRARVRPMPLPCRLAVKRGRIPSPAGRAGCPAVARHGNDDPALVAPGGKGDDPGRGIAQGLDGIAHEIDHGLIEQLRVHGELEWLGLHTGRHPDVPRRQIRLEEAQDAREQTLFAVRNQLNQVRLARMRPLVHLYVALGGGGRNPPATGRSSRSLRVNRGAAPRSSRVPVRGVLPRAGVRRPAQCAVAGRAVSESVRSRRRHGHFESFADFSRTWT